jgi:uncharacterized protein YqeY
MVDPLRQRLRSSLRDAMKARDAAAVDAYRSALSAIDNAEAVPPSTTPAAGGGPIAGSVAGAGAGDTPRRELRDDEIRAIVAAEIEDRRAAAAEYERLGHHDRAARLRDQAQLLETRLMPGEGGSAD